MKRYYFEDYADLGERIIMAENLTDAKLQALKRIVEDEEVWNDICERVDIKLVDLESLPIL